jgi:hypothetical protein
MVKLFLKLELVKVIDIVLYWNHNYWSSLHVHLKPGEESGLIEEDYRASVATLESIATTLEADCVVLRERTSECGIVGQYLIRHRADQEDFVEIR